MPRLSTNVLSTEKAVERAKAAKTRVEFRIKDARNLVLRVSPTGTKSWMFLFRHPASDVWRKKHIGDWPTFSLDKARDEARAYALEVKRGNDPTASDPLTFKELAHKYLEHHARKNARAGQRSAWTDEVDRLLKVDILPEIGSYRVEAIQKADITKVVSKVSERGSLDIADKVLGLARAIFVWGAGAGHNDTDPTLALKKQSVSKPRSRTVKDGELRRLWNGIVTAPKLSPAIRDAMILQLLLAVRIAEVMGAAKSEVDLKRLVWTIPAERTKANREHALPLSPWAAEIFKAAIERAGKSVWVFPSEYDDGPIRSKSASRAMLRLRKRLKIDDLGTHDLRRTCATGLGNIGTSDEIISRILNHAPTTVTGRVYNHAKYEAPMRRALNRWSRKLKRAVDPKDASSVPQ